ncbi:MAG: tetratricopeptide repeat protein [Nonlabens sp.]
MVDAIYERALLLYQQNRYQQAEELLRNALAQSPNDVACLHLLSEIRLALDAPREAGKLVDIAIGLAPDQDLLYATKARIMIDVERYDEAEELLKEAIYLNPSGAQYYAMLGHITLSRKRYQEAEDLANKALGLEPDNLLALNTKSTAQLKQNKKAESEATLRGALGENPEDSYTHANYGWNKLEQGNHVAALEHFKEALKFNPNNPYAQQGMMQALQAKYLLYRWFLKYQFWLGKMGAKYQWGFIIGFYVLTRLLDWVSEAIPSLSVILTPIVILLALVALSTWVIAPLSQLLFRFNKYARFLLSDKEKRATVFTAVCLATCVAGVSLIFILDDLRYASVAVVGLVLMIPWSLFYMPTKPKLMMPLAASIMTLVGVVAIYETFRLDDLNNMFSVSFLICFFALQWLINAVMIKRDNL